MTSSWVTGDRAPVGPSVGGGSLRPPKYGSKMRRARESSVIWWMVGGASAVERLAGLRFTT